MKEIVVNIYSIVGSGLCVDAADGEKVFEKLNTILNMDQKAVISFLNVEMLTAAFLNTAIGRLYRVFSFEKLKSSLVTRDISNDDKLLLKKVVDTAKAYYKNKDGCGILNLLAPYPLLETQRF